jgi:hypothetical protein
MCTDQKTAVDLARETPDDEHDQPTTIAGQANFLAIQPAYTQAQVKSGYDKYFSADAKPRSTSVGQPTGASITTFCANVQEKPARLIQSARLR